MTQARQFATILALVLIGVCAHSKTAAQGTAQVWVASWGASQQIPEPQNALPPDDLRDATVRQIFHLSVSGAALRVHVSNAFGTEALHLTSIHIARPLSPASSSIDPASDLPVPFAGSADATVPPGAELISDPLQYAVAPLSDLAVTFHIQAPPSTETGHPGSRATSYYINGDAVSAPALPNAKHVDHWYQISEIDVLGAPGAASVVALDDSITDGHGATTNGNDRWTVRRLNGDQSNQGRQLSMSPHQVHVYRVVLYAVDALPQPAAKP